MPDPGKTPLSDELLAPATLSCVLRSLRDIFFDSTVEGQGILCMLSKTDFAETVVPMIKFKQ